MSAVERGRAMVPDGWDVETILGCGLPDEPVDMSGWGALAAEGDIRRLQRLNAMFDAQATCDIVLRHNGPAALQTILESIARASSAHSCPMCPRIRAVAEFYELPVA